MKKRHESTLPWHLVPAILTLTWPTMLEQLMQTAVQYIDVAMVGSLGTQATAAVGATSTVSWLLNSSISALGVGMLAFVSQSCGSGDREKAVRASSQTVWLTLIVGILFTALTLSLSSKVPVWMQVSPDIQQLAGTYFFILYLPMLFRTASIMFGTLLRAVGDTKTPMRIGAWMNVVNIILNFLLIYPKKPILVLPFRERDWGSLVRLLPVLYPSFLEGSPSPCLFGSILLLLPRDSRSGRTGRS